MMLGQGNLLIQSTISGSKAAINSNDPSIETFSNARRPMDLVYGPSISTFYTNLIKNDWANLDFDYS